MPQEKLLTIREVSNFLGITEKEVINLAESGEMPAYKVGGVYLRFKKEHVEVYRKNFRKRHKRKPGQFSVSIGERVRDFIYFNDFYILALLAILFMLIFIWKSYQ